MLVLGVFLLLIFAYSLIARRLERTVFTGPIVFTSAGILLIWSLPRRQAHGGDHETFLWVAEISLVLLLFSEALKVGLHSLKGGNGFIVAFVAGLAIRLTYREVRAISLDFSEAAGQLLNLAGFSFSASWFLPSSGTLHWLWCCMLLRV